jgi:hypothetical protein
MIIYPKSYHIAQLASIWSRTPRQIILENWSAYGHVSHINLY